MVRDFNLIPVTLNPFLTRRRRRRRRRKNEQQQASNARHLQNQNANNECEKAEKSEQPKASSKQGKNISQLHITTSEKEEDCFLSSYLVDIKSSIQL